MDESPFKVLANTGLSWFQVNVSQSDLKYNFRVRFLSDRPSIAWPCHSLTRQGPHVPWKKWIFNSKRVGGPDCSQMNSQLAAVPSGYPNPTRYPVFLSIPDPTRFRGKQYHHQVLFFGTHKKDPRLQKKVQNLPFLCQVWLWNSSWLDNHCSRPMTHDNHPIPSIHPSDT